GLSQEALAEAAGVSARSINRWEQGRALPQPEVRRRLAEVLGIDVVEFTLGVRSGASDESPELPAVWHVPLRRNPFFTGRDVLLQARRAARPRDGSAPRARALPGFPGIGKPRAAFESASRYAGAYQAVFGVSADTPAGALAGFGELATLLALPVRSAPQFAHALAAVRQWLRWHTDWLIVLDNLEDPQVLDQIALEGRGSVLITTRAQAIGAAGGCLEVPPLPEEEGAAFLLRRSEIARVEGEASAADSAAARALATRLGGLPLALDQAGGYLEETGCGLDRYLQGLRTQEHLPPR